MTAAEMSLALFTMVNSARVLAYLPQIVLIARDRSGARAISYSTWAMFSASHLSTVLYAVLAVSDRAMAAIVLVNMTFCLGIIALTAYKRRGTGQINNLTPINVPRRQSSRPSLTGPVLGRLPNAKKQAHTNLL